jgi:uncharacterized repeat protein (TIGR02543 family)
MTVPVIYPVDIQGSMIRVPTMGNGLIDYFTDGESNFFLIDMGTVRNSYISTIATAAHRTSRTEFTLTNVTMETLQQASHQSITDSVTITDTRSTTHTAGVSVSVTAKIPFVKEAKFQGSWNGSWTTTHSHAAANTQSLQTSDTRIQQMTETVSITNIMDRSDPHGIYRYALYAVKRIHFIVETTRDNSQILSMEPIVVVQSFVRDLTFCEHGIFDNAPEQTLDLEDGFYRFLPIPPTPDQGFVLTINSTTGGTVNPESRIVHMGDTVGIFATPANEHIFVRWERVSGGTVTFGSSNSDSTTVTLTSEQDVTIRAVFETAPPSNFTVTFNRNSGSGTAPSSQTVRAGSPITLPSGTGLSRPGFTFGGWNTDASGTGTNRNAGSSFTPSGNITLFARWNLITSASSYRGTAGGADNPLWILARGTGNNLHNRDQRNGLNWRIAFSAAANDAVNLNLSGLRDAGFRHLRITVEFGARTRARDNWFVTPRLYVCFNRGHIRNNDLPPIANRYQEWELRPSSNGQWETHVRSHTIAIGEFIQEGITVRWATNHETDFEIGHRIIRVEALR